MHLNNHMTPPETRECAFHMEQWRVLLRRLRWWCEDDSRGDEDEEDR